MSPTLIPILATGLGFALLLLPWSALAMNSGQMARFRSQTVQMFLHGFENYMTHAFPEDELRPVSCTPLTRDRKQPRNFGVNDVLGNYSLTLLDSLSTLAVLAGGTDCGGYAGRRALADFQGGIEQFVAHYGDGRPGPSGRGLRSRGFDLDSKVQVFETVIRGVGGLLSAHLFAVGDLPIPGYNATAADAQGAGNDDDLLEPAPIRWPSGFVYDGQLLRLAYDLSERLLPAFYTGTGLPYPRVNLRHGIPFYLNSPLHRNGATGAQPGNRPVTVARPLADQVTETCSAGAGSLVLEFTLLSRLTGDSRFERAAKRSFWAVWDRRSAIGLIGNGIDAEKGHWIGVVSGIGAGMDSFFEYALKSHILLSGPERQEMQGRQEWNDQHNATRATRWPSTRPWLDPDSIYPPLSPEKDSPDAFLAAWHQSYAAIKRHLYAGDHQPHYVNSFMFTGSIATTWIDSLGAFFPGLLTLAGELEEAIRAQLLYTALWTRHAAMPERWSFRDKNVEPGIGWWPGRPEFIESTYHIYHATGDPWYLYVGQMVLEDIQQRCWTECGWSGLQDVATGEKSDRMESFFLGETVKYMYLLFDPNHPLNKLDAAFVFNTEGHPLIIPKRISLTSRRRHDDGGGSGGGGRTAERRAKTKPLSMPSLVDGHGRFRHTCPAPPLPFPLTGSATAARTDMFHAASFVNLHKTPNDRQGQLLNEVVAETNDDMAGDMGFEMSPEMSPQKKRRADMTSEPRIRPPPAAQSNHTIFPWTLPRAMLPSDGTCAKLTELQFIQLDFPAPQPLQGVPDSFRSQSSVGQLARASNFRLYILGLHGTRMFLAPEEDVDGGGEPIWRVSGINHILLGRDEVISVYADVIGTTVDPLFTRLRDQYFLEVVALYDVPPAPTSAPSRNLSNSAAEGERTEVGYTSAINPTVDVDDGGIDLQLDHLSSTIAEMKKSLLDSLLDVVSSILDPVKSAQPSTQPILPQFELRHFTAALPIGQGAIPPPEVPDAPPSSELSDIGTTSLPWTTVYAAGQACAGRLPDAAPRQHQVLVMRRGGCSLSQKLANIPSFAPDPRALQLVLIVDEVEQDDGGDEAGCIDDDDDANTESEQVFWAHESHARRCRRHPSLLPPDRHRSRPRRPWAGQPFLAEQRTPSGMKRPHPVAMVVVYTEPGEYDRLAAAQGIGIRRRYFAESRGIHIRNIDII